MSVAPDRLTGNVVPIKPGAGYQPLDTTQNATSTLESYKRLFTESRDLTQTARDFAKKHRRYYDGKIDPKLDRELRRKRQPNFNINRVRPGVEGMVGVVEKGKSDPRAYPRNPQDEDASEVATDTLRYVADQNRWQQDKLKVFRNMCIEGTAACLIEVDDKLEVKIRRIRYEEFFYDPYSREPDFSDASYMGLAKWQYVDEIVAAYPAFESQLRTSCDNGSVFESGWEDRPQNGSGSTTWNDSKRKRMLIVEMYKRERGVWMKCVFVGDLKLEEGPSPYLTGDDEAKPCNPIEAHSVFVDDENNRYGVVADMVGPQDEINVYRRKAAHYATFRQVQETDPISAYADPEEVRREAARPDGVIPPGYGVVTNDKFQMDVELLAEAKSEIERIGPNPAILGRQGADASGRATLVRQQAGLTELAHLFAGLDDLELRIYRQCWARIRQYWTQPKFVRVTDDINAIKFIQINEPVWGPNVPQIDQQTGKIVVRPQFMGMKNAVAEMGVDIIIDSTPDTANVQQEQYNALVELAKIPGALGSNPGMILIKASSLPHKRELLDELEAQAQQPPPQPPPLTPDQQMANSLALREKAANIEKTTAQGHEANARAVKLQMEAHTTLPAAEADRAAQFSKAQLQQANAVSTVTNALQQRREDQFPDQPQQDV